VASAEKDVERPDDSLMVCTHHRLILAKTIDWDLSGATSLREGDQDPLDDERCCLAVRFEHFAERAAPDGFRVEREAPIRLMIAHCGECWLYSRLLFRPVFKNSENARGDGH